MIKRGLISLCATLVLLVLGSCTRTEQPTGTVTLTFTTGEIATRATTPGDGDPVDGGGIKFVDADSNPETPDTPDLVILVENNSTHAISKRYLGTDTGDAVASYVEDTKQKRLQVKFTGLDPGVYTVYAIANTNNGGVWFSPSKDFSTITASSLKDLKFSNQIDRPAVSDRMPLSAKGTLTVQSTRNGSVSLELLRSVAKVTVKFKNVTGGTLTLKDVQFYITDMNPKCGYLIPQASTDYTTTASDYRPLEMGPVFTSDSGTGIAISGTELTGPFYVFPSRAQGGLYYCSAKFDWKLKKGENSELSGTYKNGYYADPSDPTGGLRVFDKNFEDIPVLLRNQHLTIEIRIGEGSNVSFNFIVGDWEEKTESVEFN